MVTADDADAASLFDMARNMLGNPYRRTPGSTGATVRGARRPRAPDAEPERRSAPGQRAGRRRTARGCATDGRCPTVPWPDRARRRRRPRTDGRTDVADWRGAVLRWDELHRGRSMACPRPRRAWVVRARTGSVMEVRDKLYIDGAWVPSTGTGTSRSSTPPPRRSSGPSPRGRPRTSTGPSAAAAAFPRGRRRRPTSGPRSWRACEGLAARTEEIATLISQEVGMPFTLSNLIQVGLPVMSFATAAQLPPSSPSRSRWATRSSCASRSAWSAPSRRGTTRCTRSPPRWRRRWPPAARWCSSRARSRRSTPSSWPRSSTRSACPPGVFNLVTGVGPVVGEAIASHPLVDMVSFTGSTRAGKRVMQLASEAVKRVALELGGKSPNVILEDADLGAGRARRRGRLLPELGPDLLGAHPHARAPVPPGRGRGRWPSRRPRPTRRATPSTPRPASGPLVSATQRERVRGYIQKGVDEGATLVTGGAETPEGLDKGYFVRPTVFSDVTRDMTIAQEEIFGPVLSIIPYDTEEEAIEIANDTVYGLAGGVWAGDKEHAEARRPAAAHRPGRGERRRLQPAGALRRLQAVRHRARARQVRPRGVPRDQGDAALRRRRAAALSRVPPRAALCLVLPIGLPCAKMLARQEITGRGSVSRSRVGRGRLNGVERGGGSSARWPGPPLRVEAAVGLHARGGSGTAAPGSRSSWARRGRSRSRQWSISSP